MIEEIEIQVWAGQSVASNACTLCDKSPKVGTVSIFLKGYLGTHIVVHLCEDHWNDVGILLALSKAFIDKVNFIENGPTWKEVTGREPMPEIDRLMLILKDAIRRDPEFKRAFTPEVVDKIMEKEGRK
jgi:hypothetical protein